MKIIFDKKGKKSPAVRYTYYAIAALILSVVNIALLDFIAVGTLTPDFLLILCVWIAITEGQFIGIVAGFLCGILFDFISHDVIGTNALAKTAAAFAAGWFFKENKANVTIGSFRFLAIIFVCSLVHNMIYFFFYIKSTEISFFPFFLKYGLATSLYTTVFAVFPMLVKLQRKGI
ncbi:MAG: rod shape-determining protein MreD [Ignavibacteriae bacterium]|nr:rod shape-determining protein MreD [Ignavibacteriota bacterium]